MPSTGLRVIDAAATRQLLPIEVCIDLMADAMRAVSRGEVSMSPRTTHARIDRSGHLGIMAGSCLQPRTFGCKVLSITPANAARGLPTMRGAFVIFDAETGSPTALIHGATLTSIRTAATSALATRLLARADARVLLVLGSGTQAAEHVDAICRVRDIERVIVWSRSADRGHALCATLAGRMRIPVTFDADAGRACASADVICSTTAASTPVLFGRWVRKGTHVNLIGSHDATSAEGDSELIAAAAVFVDSIEGAVHEAGEIVQAMAAGEITRLDLRGELGQLVDGQIPGRVHDDDVTVFKSIGLLAQDLVAAAYVEQQAAACEGVVHLGF